MNTNLPISEFRDQIVRAVADNQVVIITAETGAGKSTQVPQFLLEEGYTVVATQPRRMAARTVAERVAEEVGTSLGETVGFRTAFEKCDSPQTKVLFCTDGLQLVRELTGSGSKHQVLIIDEVHEWNRNIETLVAWSKLQIAKSATFKVVLMSATVEAEKLAAFFGEVGVISVPGRLYPVTNFPAQGDAAEMAIYFAAKGRNVLVFAPGKADIAEIIEKIKEKQNRVEVISLHGGLSSAEQRQAFTHYDHPKIVVSTNVAQTSVTIDDIDAVVDTGTEKRTEILNGIEGLHLGEISQADCQQRKGRAGRTKPGVYCLCSEIPFEKRVSFPIPEILRSRLDQLVLRLAQIGFDATELEFFHQPNRETLLEAKEALKRLGALDDSGNITKLGLAMSRLPVDVHFAKMIVEAQERDVIEEVLTVVACLQAGGVRGQGKKENGMQMPPKWKLLTKEHDSDLLAELDCFIAAYDMNNQEMREHDIIVKRFYQAKEIRDRLARDLCIDYRPIANHERQEVLKASVAGMVDHLYRHSWGREYIGSEDQSRQLDRNSVVFVADWVTALPFDLGIETTTRLGEKVPMTLHLLNAVSRVDPDWLIEIAPQLVSRETIGYRYDRVKQEVVFETVVAFNGVQLKVTTSPALPCDEATQALARAMAGGSVPYSENSANIQIVRQVNNLAWQSREVEELTLAKLTGIFAAKLGDAYRISDLHGVDLALKLEELLPEEFVKKLAVPEPETISFNGVDFRIRYHSEISGYGFGTALATISFPADDMSKVQDIPVTKTGRISEIEVTGENGVVIASGYSLTHIRAQMEQQRKMARRDAFHKEVEKRLRGLQESANYLANEAKDTSELEKMIRAARLGYSFSTRSTQSVRTTIRQAEKEIERLKSQDATEAQVESLIAGRLLPEVARRNQETMNQLQILAIRSNGFIEPLTEENLLRFYKERLEGGIDPEKLSLHLEDYAPDDVLSDLEEEGLLAPVRIHDKDKHGTEVVLTVDYRLETIHGKETPIGVISVKVSTFQKLARLPKLPFDLPTILEVINGNGEVLVRGTDLRELDRKVDKKRKAKSRAKSVRKNSLDDPFAAPYQPSMPPNWYKGKGKWNR